MDRRTIDRTPIDRGVFGTTPPVTYQQYTQISVLLYDDTNSMLVKRNPWTGCSLYLLTPKITDTIDKIGTAKFSILDIGNSTATEKSLFIEGVNVALVWGRAVIFSGKIRRSTQNTQAGFSTTTRTRLWDIECDSDLAKLSNINVDSTVLTANGQTLYASPGTIANLILTPATGATDIRGDIDTTGAFVTYQLNSTDAESVGDMYTHMMRLYSQTNYDLRSRPDYLHYEYTSFNGVTVITNTAANWTVNEFVGSYILFFPAIGTSGCVTHGKVFSNTQTTITLTGIPADVALIPTTLNTFTIFRGYKIDFAHDLSQTTAIKNFDVNKDVFEYRDNDDKRKLSTKMVVKGKDIFGKSISVALSGVHKFNETTQFYDNSTYINLPTEGYIKENTYQEGKVLVTFVSVLQATGTLVSDGTANITLQGTVTAFQVDDLIYFYVNPTSGSLPAPLSSLNWYYVTSVTLTGTDTILTVSATRGGTNINVLANIGGVTAIVTRPGYCIADNTKGLFKPLTEIMFHSEGSGQLPTTISWGLHQYYKYYICSTNVEVSTTARFCLSVTANTYPLGALNLANDSVPINEVMLYNATIPEAKIALYGWGYSFLNGFHVLPITPGLPSYRQLLILSSSEKIAADGSLYTELLLDKIPDADYANKGFLLSEIIFTQATANINLTKITTSFVTKFSETPSDNHGIFISYTQFANFPVNTEVYFLAQTGQTLPAPLVAGTPYYVVSATYGTPQSRLIISTSLGGAPLDLTSDGSSTTQCIHVGTGAFDTILIGEETVTVRSRGIANIRCFVEQDRATSSLIKRYPHGIGAMVANTDYTEASPQTDSPIDLYGLRIDTRTVDANTTYGMLDTYAASLLVGLGSFYKKATTWGPLYYVKVVSTNAAYGGISQIPMYIPPRPTDRVSFTEYTGATPESYEIVSVTIDFDRQTITFELGDFEKNLYTSMIANANALNRPLS